MGTALAPVGGMAHRDDNRGTHADEEVAGAAQNGQTATVAAGGNEPDVTPAKDADSPASKPHGTLRDQVTTMEAEGQAQPQADELPADSETTGKGVPPLPEPDVEGVGNESGPSAGTATDRLDRK
jgi:hypothetical protein